MSSDDYQVHNIYRYTRQTYKQNRGAEKNKVLSNTRDEGAVNVVEDCREGALIDRSPRNDPVASPEFCVDPESDLEYILHKKCPVITLAQQQLARLLEESGQLMCVPREPCTYSPSARCLCVLKELLSWWNKSTYVFLALIFVAFFAALLLGAATCGIRYGKFNNPILNCIDNYFIPDNFIRIEDTFRCIT